MCETFLIKLLLFGEVVYDAPELVESEWSWIHFTQLDSSGPERKETGNKA